MFHPVSSKTSFPQLEEKIFALWKNKNVFERSVEARQGNKRFILYEGPPTANGSPGIHHVLARVFKDVIPRYKAMKGYHAPRIAGWDTHGLPVELEVEKALGLASKRDIEEFGIDKFNARCRESVFSYLKEWEAITERIAFWVDLENAYVTMNNDYIETVWWAIKEMWKKGLVYQGYKVTPHCPRCGTSLSSHEVALGYQDDTEDPSVYIKFRVVKGLPEGLSKDKPAYFLAWTTTPWTLPGNTALAVAPQAEYSLLEGEKDYLVLASTLVGVVGLEDYKVKEKLTGSQLVGVYYEPLYKADIFSDKGDEPAYRVIEGDFVSMDEGTGIVHIAPAYGEIDFEVGEKENLPLVHAVGLDGIVKKSPTGYTPSVYKRMLREEALALVSSAKEVQSIPGAGKFVKDADKDILDDLESRGLLFRRGTIRHTYPFCWRCETPLLYYAKQTWYIRTTAIKDDLIARNEEINWYPEHIKYGRFGDWLQNNVDWAFSRERYWGTPLPVWQCESCGNYECVGGVEELKKKPGFSGFREPLDLHRPFVDELTFDCPKCGTKMRRVNEVIDCWFDSGAMPIAQHHYPYENKTIFKDGRFPADYISEAVDQTRGWFYSLHAISTLLFNRRCFSNVICLGHVLDAKGEKMSKAKGNVVEPWAVINKYGADALRWYFLTSTAAGNVYRFDETMVAEVSRRFLSTLWNVYSFFVTYANIDRFTPSGEKITAELSELDRWITSELNQLIADVDRGLDGYNPTEAGRRIEGFVDDLSNWYVRRSRRRFWKSENDADKLAAYTTLYECLSTLSRLLAPLAPFLAEEMYQNLVCSVLAEAPDSVHLADFPTADESKIDKQLINEVRVVIELVSKVRALRNEKSIKVRQPISKMVVAIKAEWIKRAISRFASEIKEEVNIKEIEFTDDISKYDSRRYAFSTWGTSSTGIDTQLTRELKAEGVAREVVRRLQNMRRSAGFDIADHITTYYQGEAYIRRVMTDFADYIKQETLSNELVEGVPQEGVFSERHKLSGYEITLGVKRLA
jgi:isoleucyl-tRNA synthetase